MVAKKTKKIKEEPQKPPEVNPEVPAIDKNAPLKIDATEVKGEEAPIEKSGKKLYIVGGIVLGLIVVGVLGFIFLLAANTSKENLAIAPVIQEAVVSPTPAAPVLVRSEWTFEVLNGSGTAGVAKKAADKLETLGYKVVSIDNADRQTYKGNGLFVSQEMQSKVDLLVADLKNTLTIATVAGVLKDSTVSARVIIGREE